MIQIYEAANQAYEKNGDAVLHPLSCTVSEVLKGTWEMSLQNPYDENAGLIRSGAVIKADTNIGKGQLFRIYKHERSENGVNASAYPIFFDAGKNTAILDKRPTNKTGDEALQILTQGTPYTAESDIRSARTAYYQKVNLMEALCGEDENSFINRWGGEPIYDNYHVTINSRAGGDHGARAAFGYNLQGITEHVRFDDVVTRIIPEAYNGYMLEGERPWVDSPNIKKYPIVYTKVVQYSEIKLQEDCTGEDETGYPDLESLQKALKERALQDFEAGIDKPEVSYDIEFLPLEDTVEYEDLKDLVQIGLGDSVECENKGLDIITKGRATSLTYDCIREKVSALHVGDIESSYFDDMSLVMQAAADAITKEGGLKGEKIIGIMNAAVTQLRAQRTQAKKLDVVAMLCEDTDPKSKNYGAMCIGTKGFMIASERTADGKDWDWRTFGTGYGFVADCIVAGLLASRNYNEETGEGFYINLDTGEASMNNAHLKGEIESKRDGYGLYVSITPGAVSLLSDYNGKKVSVFRMSGGTTLDEETGELRGVSPYITLGPKSSSFAIQFSDSILNAWRFGKDGIGDKNTYIKGGKTGRIEFSDGTYLDVENGWVSGGKTKEGEF